MLASQYDLEIIIGDVGNEFIQAKLHKMSCHLLMIVNFLAPFVKLGGNSG